MSVLLGYGPIVSHVSCRCKGENESGGSAREVVFTGSLHLVNSCHAANVKVHV